MRMARFREARGMDSLKEARDILEMILVALLIGLAIISAVGEPILPSEDECTASGLPRDCWRGR